MDSIRKNALVLVLAIAAISTGGAFALLQDNQEPQMTSDNGKIIGHIETILRDENGQIKAYRQTDNLIVTDGTACAAKYLFGAAQSGCGQAAGTAFNAIGVGTGTTAPDAADTVLQTQRSNKRTDASVADSGTNGAVIDATWAAGVLQNQTGTVAITESGIFNSVNNATGDLFARQTFTAVNVGSADTLTVTWTVTFADSDST